MNSDSDKETNNSNIMGIDMELGKLAVVSIQNPAGKEINRQFHNGNQARFIRKKYRSLRRKLGQAKKLILSKKTMIKSKEGGLI
ncbi:MAG: hypothetical protein R6V14_00440 [Halanaerobiales bacterium]